METHTDFIQTLAPAVSEGKAVKQLQQIRHQLADVQTQQMAAGLPVPVSERRIGASPSQVDPEDSFTPHTVSPPREKAKSGSVFHKHATKLAENVFFNRIRSHYAPTSEDAPPMNPQLLRCWLPLTTFCKYPIIFCGIIV